MSARNFSNNLTNSAYIPRIPCCKVCKDAGEPENIYSSHYVKDREGNVTCPKLKSIVCLNCNKRGHTSSYCKDTRAKNPQHAVRAVADTDKKPIESVVAKGRFACLFEDDSDDEKLIARKHSRSITATSARKHNLEEKPDMVSHQINVSNVFDFPSLSADTKYVSAKTTEPKSFSYANMAAKPVEPKPIRQEIVVPVRPASPTTEPPSFYRQKASEMDWAMEESDSDYYDDEDEDF
uniref:Nanos-type domain-containing protein n=1 Tax=viral metagenome TaxID=1070528 RepID=A0A6C0JX55_9ZZZZ